MRSRAAAAQMGAQPNNTLAGIASPWQLFRWKFARHKLAMVSLAFLGLMYLAATFADFVAPFDPRDIQAQWVDAPPQRLHFFDADGNFHIRPFVHPLVKSVDLSTGKVTYTEDTTQIDKIGLFVRGDEYEMWGLFRSDVHLFGVDGGAVFSPLGKDSLGRDVFSRIIFGARISLSIGFIGVIVGFVSGLVIGGLSGLAGGWVDQVIMRVTEVFVSVPTLPIWLALAAALPSNWSITQTYIAMTVILALFGVVTGASRTVRGKFMSLKQEDYVLAARLDGAGNMRLIRRYLFPNFFSHQIADLTLSIPAMILAETSLSFLGLGMQAPAISWGVLLQEGRFVRTLAESPWLLTPAVFVVLTVLAFNFVGDGLRDASDPYSRI